MTDAERNEAFVRDLLSRSNVYDRLTHRVVSGIAAVNLRDANGHRLSPEAVRFHLPIPVLVDHNWTRPIGVIQGVRTTASHFEFVARLCHAFHWAGDIWNRIKLGTISAVSAGLEPEIQDRSVRWHWRELSVCGGRDPDSQILLVKTVYRGDSVFFDSPEPGREIAVHRDVRRRYGLLDFHPPRSSVRVSDNPPAMP